MNQALPGALKALTSGTLQTIRTKQSVRVASVRMFSGLANLEFGTTKPNICQLN